MHSRCAALCATLFATLAAPAQAGDHWLCTISGEGTRLICVADVGPTDDTAATNRTAATSVVNGTSFPLDTARLYTVQMWSPPTDLAFVTQLAHSTICYRSPGCHVTLTTGPWLQTTNR
jgi:hypothetical protein